MSTLKGKVPNPVPTSGPYIANDHALLTRNQWLSVTTADEPTNGMVEAAVLSGTNTSIIEAIQAMYEGSVEEGGLRASADVEAIFALKEICAGRVHGVEIQQLVDHGDIVINPDGTLSFYEESASDADSNASNAIDDISLPETMSDEDQAALRTLFALIEEVNGQDAYSVTAMSLGRLKSDEFLVLPENLRGASFNIPASDVGTSWNVATSPVKYRDFVNIYVLNKAVGADTKDPIFFGLVRAEAVKMGWFNGQAEVRYANPPADAYEIFLKDSKDITESLEASRTAAFLIPFMNESVFRTTGHHFLSGLIDEYDRKYQALCSSCLAPDLPRRLRSAELWHKAMHWVSPARTRAVIDALSETARLPHTIKLRKDAAPAGTAIVTTTCAVIDALDSCNWADEVEKSGGFDFSLIRDTTAAIKADVTKYHNAYFAYGVTGPSEDEKAILAAAVLEAQKFAPVAQGFVDAMYTDSSLGRAKALRKHAEASPVLMRRATRVFRNLARAETEEIADIFRSTSGTKTASKPSSATATTTPA